MACPKTVAVRHRRRHPERRPARSLIGLAGGLLGSLARMLALACALTGALQLDVLAENATGLDQDLTMSFSRPGFEPAAGEVKTPVGRPEADPARQPAVLAQNAGGSYNPDVVRPAGNFFDHAAVGFPLTGAHQGAPCESCHVGGRFKATPLLCFACHNGGIATGMSFNHPRVTEQCVACHQTTNWTDIQLIDHTQARTVCGTCHNGVIAAGKPVQHIPTSAPCETCHKTTASFAMSVHFTHQPNDTVSRTVTTAGTQTA
jgi:hypothetical protein